MKKIPFILGFVLKSFMDKLEDEKIELFDRNNLPENILDDTRWVIEQLIKD